MNKIILTIVFIASVIQLNAQQNNLSLSPSIKEVVLFLDGAEVRSVDQLSLKKGETRLVVTGLSPLMRDESLQLSLSDGVEIISVSTHEVKSDPKLASKESALTEMNIRRTQDQVKILQIRQDALEAEKKLLLANQSIGGQQTGVSLVELGKAADFFRERILKVNTELFKLDGEREIILRSLDSLKSVQKILMQGKVNTRKELTVLLNAATDQTPRLSLKYIVDDASWEPSYDIIATDITKPVTLKYKAQINNETGVDWNNVKLTLSTSDPTLSATRPVLTTWTLNYSSQGNEGYLQNKLSNNLPTSDTIKYTGGTEISVEELGSSFEIGKSYSIRSSTEPFTIDVLQQTMNATYQYLVIPKVESSAFLIAKVTGWEKLNLIDATANVYFGNTYIGQSEISTRQMSDTLELSFGRDNQILVSRAKLEDTGGSKMIGTKRTESFLYEIVVKNNRKNPISIKIQDQIPVSQETDITVDASEISNASLDNLSGRLQWLKTIAPDQVTKLRVGFSVKYPKNRNVIVRKQRIVRTPRYKKS